MADDPVLVVVKGPDGPGSYRLDRRVLVIGRDSAADLVFESEHISRRHLEIITTGGSVSVRDLNSTNGSSLNGDPLDNSPTPLNVGDHISLADDLVVLRLQESGSTVPLQRGQSATTPSATGELRINAGSRDVQVRGTMLAPPLSRKEFDVLATMSAKAGEAVSRDDVAVAGWPERDLGDVGDAEITQLIKRVRERIESDPRHPRLLTTVRGFGYKLEIGQSPD